MPEKRFDLRREDQDAVPVPVVERLLAEPVARQEESLPSRVPDREREHPPQPIHAPGALVFEEVHDGLGVASRPEPMTPRFQPGTELAVVVDLAVEDDPE